MSVDHQLRRHAELLQLMLCKAVNQARNVRAGGQGLMNVERVLAAIRESGSEEETDFTDGVHGMIEVIRESPPSFLWWTCPAQVKGLSTSRALASIRSSGTHSTRFPQSAKLLQTG